MSKKTNFRILVVEDDDINFIYLTAAFETENLIIDRVISGHQAIDRMNTKNQIYDLILMDIKLPGIDGFETTKEIRKKYPKIPIIAQTALYFSDGNAKFDEYGFNSVIFKPFLHEDLMKLIYNCLKKTNIKSNKIMNLES